jgi:hypothetical protein
MDSITVLDALPHDRPFTATEAAREGVDRRLLYELVSSGFLRHPVRSVFYLAGLRDTVELRVACLKSVLPPDAFATDHTAAWLHAGAEALPPNADLKEPELTFLRPSDAGCLRNKICHSGERSVLPEDLMEVGGVPTTTPLRTAWDLGRLQRADQAMWGIDLMMKVANIAPHELIAGLPRFKGERGVVQLRGLVTWADPGSESFGESALRLRWRRAEIPKPESQISLCVDGVEVARIDQGLPEVLFGAEYFGEEWHGEDEAEHDETRLRWIRDERGYAIEVFRREDVFGAAQTADFRLRRAYEQALATLPQKRHFLLLQKREMALATARSADSP